MLRGRKWIAPLASLVLLAGLNIAQSKAADAKAADATAATGKAKVTVTVVDADGKPVAGATVNISLAPPKGKKAPSTQPDGAARTKPPVIESGVTGADGTFALTNIADGNFVVTSNLKGTGRGKETVTISDGKDATVSVTLAPPKKKAA